MGKDPIVEEIQIIRDKYAASFNYDINAIIEDTQKRQLLLKDRVVSFATAPQKLRGSNVNPDQKS
jgi:hypothetical protein